MSICGHSLYDGMTCELPSGHIGSHTRSATAGMAALTWRSSSFPPPMPQAKRRVDYLELIRATRAGQ